MNNSSNTPPSTINEMEPAARRPHLTLLREGVRRSRVTIQRLTPAPKPLEDPVLLTLIRRTGAHLVISLEGRDMDAFSRKLSIIERWIGQHRLLKTTSYRERFAFFIALKAELNSLLQRPHLPLPAGAQSALQTTLERLSREIQGLEHYLSAQDGF